MGEARHAYDNGFIFDGESRDCFYKGDADAGIDELVKALGWEVRSPLFRGFLKSHMHESRKI